MPRSSFQPPPRPDPSSLKNPPPFPSCKTSTLRAGRVKKVGPFESAIFKTPLPFPVTLTVNGIQNDEHAYEPHRSPDKALLQYCSAHYEHWKSEIPTSANHFKPGAFGENLYNDEMSERNVCIGDRIKIGKEVVLEVTEPRAPCFKLNHRFEVPDMARRAQTLFRTGWLYRVITPGVICEGDEIVLVERVLPGWSVARVMYYLFLDTGDTEMMREIVKLPALGFEIREKFEKRLKKGEAEDQDARLLGDVPMDTWAEYKIVQKRRLTSSVMEITFEALENECVADASINGKECLDAEKVQPGSHIRLKLGGNLVRAYSVVGGTQQRFSLGIALSKESRGGSRYLHEQANIGDVLTCSRITTSFPLSTEAKRHAIIAAGIGITAFMAALEYLKINRKDFILYYAHTGEMPYEQEIMRFGKENVRIYDKSADQRMDIENIISTETDKHTHIYTCGPERLMNAVIHSATKHNISPDRTHREEFTVTTSGDPFTVELKESNKTLNVGAMESLLDVLRKVGLDVDSSCEVGNCGTCKVDVCSGRVEHRGTGLMDDEKGGAMLSCVSRGVGRIVLDL